MWFVGDKTQHDEISILTVHAMSGVWFVSWLASHVTDVLHDFMLMIEMLLFDNENELNI